MTTGADALTVNVRLGGYFRDGFDDVRELAVHGDREEPFLVAMDRSFVERHNFPLDDALVMRCPGLRLQWENQPVDELDPDDPPIRVWVRCEESTTVGEVIRLLGDEADANPATTSVDLEGGWGGDSGGPIIVTLLTVFATYYSTARGVIGNVVEPVRLAQALLNRKHRRLAAEWLETQEVTMPLRQAVKAQNHWEMRDFRREFGMDLGWSAKLLRDLGYEKREWGGWSEISPQ